MPSFADSAVIFILALMLFGPKKLPQLARQLGKLMAEFRRASNEFRMQMEDELRIEDQKEHQKKVDAMAGPPSDLPEPEHPHLPSTTAEMTHEIQTPTHGALGDGSNAMDEQADGYVIQEADNHVLTAALPIAESGSLRMMPPSTGLPVERNAYGTSDHGSGRYEGNGNYENNGNHANGDSIPEHTILPPPVGMSSEEPAAETRTAEEQTHA